jgi:hypothetical protein
MFRLRLINAFLCYLFASYLNDCYSVMFCNGCMLSMFALSRVCMFKCGMVMLIACDMLLVTNSRVCSDESVRVVLIDN